MESCPGAGAPSVNAAADRVAAAKACCVRMGPFLIVSFSSSFVHRSQMVMAHLPGDHSRSIVDSVRFGYM